MRREEEKRLKTGIIASFNACFLTWGVLAGLQGRTRKLPRRDQRSGHGVSLSGGP